MTLPRGLQAGAATPGSGSPDTAQHPCGVETGWRLQSVERVFGSQSLNTPVQPGNSRGSLPWFCNALAADKDIEVTAAVLGMAPVLRMLLCRMEWDKGHISV